jgi:ubiquinone/menaquinone biosynthesis C-methylase UbiE
MRIHDSAIQGNKIRQQFNRLATVYDRQWKYFVTNTLEVLKTWVHLSSTEKVLDIACGTGEFERMVLAENSTQQIVGVDISEQMVAFAQRLLRSIAKQKNNVTNGCRTNSRS